MLAYLNIKKYTGSLGVELITESKLGRFKPKYHNTVQQILQIPGRIEGIVIPDDLGGRYDYDVLLMILHIRLFSDDALSQLPIFIYVDDETRYYEFFENSKINEHVYNSVGVSIEGDFPTPDSVELIKIDESALVQFLKEKAGHPWFTEGRHNQANRWGPYTFLLVLNKVLGKNSNNLKEVENVMFEEPYLKWLANKITVQEDTDNIKTRLVYAQNGLKMLWEVKKNKGKHNKQLRKINQKLILIVEDRLDDGWRHVYNAVFCTEILGTEILWAKNESEALEKFNEDLAFVILDMRLSDDTCNEEEEPAGISLAKKFRQEHPFVPVIVATASNKSWVLQELTNQGIDAYWVKASPELDTDFDHMVDNVFDFYKKVISTLEWSLKTRKWNESLYHVAGVVNDTDKINGKRLKGKAESFHALMQHSFTPFSREISKGLQQNLAFLIAYSCMNDLVSWVIDKDQAEGSGSTLDVWYTKIGTKKEELIRKIKRKNHKTYYEIHKNGTEFTDFPDKPVALVLLGRYGLSEQRDKFREMSELRNGLPLIHGKTAESQITSKHVDLINDDQIDDVIEILSDLVNKHSHQ